MTTTIARWREEIFEIIDAAEARCISMTEQHRRIERVLARFAAEVRDVALDDAARICVLASENVSRHVVAGVQQETLRRLVVDVAALCGEGIRLLKDEGLPQPNVPLGNNPAPEEER
jgi:hypothetical protein